MKRREFMILLGGAAGSTVLWPRRAQAQRKGPWRIGQVRTGTLETMGRSANSLEERLSNLGYTHGNNIMLINRFIAPQPQAMEAAIQELLPKIDLLVP